jgi:hypothetical protein
MLIKKSWFYINSKDVIILKKIINYTIKIEKAIKRFNLNDETFMNDDVIIGSRNHARPRTKILLRTNPIPTRS